MVRGASSSPLRNPDPVTRLYLRSGGCVVFGNEWMTEGSYDNGLLMMVSLFGPMPGSYDGPYPDQATAYTAIGGAAVVNLMDIAADRMLIAGRTIALQRGTGSRMLGCFSEGPATDVLDRTLLAEYGEAHAIIWGGRCVILEIPIHPPAVAPAPPREQRVLILIDADHGNPFASYYAQPDAAFVPYRLLR